jgi:hypothetical protein
MQRQLLVAGVPSGAQAFSGAWAVRTEADAPSCASGQWQELRLEVRGTPLSPAVPPPPAAAPSGPQLDMAMLDGILGYTGRANGSIVQYSVGRSESIMEMGHELLPSMGVATAINFQATGPNTAAITGDFVMTESEVNAVARALRANGIEVTAVHQHHLGEEPRLFYMHFWANDDPAKLAQGLRSGLDQTNSARLSPAGL